MHRLQPERLKDRSRGQSAAPPTDAARFTTPFNRSTAEFFLQEMTIRCPEHRTDHVVAHDPPSPSIAARHGSSSPPATGRVAHLVSEALRWGSDDGQLVPA